MSTNQRERNRLPSLGGTYSNNEIKQKQKGKEEKTQKHRKLPKGW